MGIDDAVRAARFIKAGTCIPMHYNTFDVIKADPYEFARKVEAEGLHAVVIEPGKEFKIN